MRVWGLGSMVQGLGDPIRKRRPEATSPRTDLTMHRLESLRTQYPLRTESILLGTM